MIWFRRPPKDSGERRFALRLAVGLAGFEVVASFGWLFEQSFPLVALLGAITMPFAVWGLLGWPMAWVGSVRPNGRPVGVGLLLALAAGYLLYFGKKNGVVPRFATEGVWFLVGLAVFAACLRVPSARCDRWLPRLLWVAWLPALLGFGIWVTQAPQAHVVPYSSAADAEPGAVAGGQRPDLVLISWDTVRADVLSAHGGVGLDTPNFDRLVREGVMFEDAVASTPITGPSHATMLTGLYAPSHGLRSNVTLPMGAVPTLPALLGSIGYRNGGFVSAYPVLGKFGFARGFHRYDDRLDEEPLSKIATLRFRSFLWLGALHDSLPKRPKAYTPGDQVLARAQEWMAAAGDEPQFLFLHFYDAHAPFEPPAALRAKYEARAAELRPEVYDPRNAEEWTMYHAEIEQLDRMLGTVLADLEARDPGLENTMIVLTSDHGECFGEAGVHLNHVPSIHEATQHVPLVVRFPGARGAGTRVPETVTHLDLMPTLLAEGGVEESQWPELADAYPLQLVLGPGLGYEERTVYLEAQQETLARTQGRKQGWRTGSWKLVEIEDGTHQLFRFREDEDTDLAAVEPDLLARLSEAMHAFFEALPKADVSPSAISAADQAALDSLGYAEGVEDE